MKLLLLAVILLVIYLIFFKKTASQSANTKPKKPLSSDDMIPCHSCHTYATIDDMILSNGNYYCSSTCVKEQS